MNIFALTPSALFDQGGGTNVLMIDATHLETNHTISGSKLRKAV